MATDPLAQSLVDAAARAIMSADIEIHRACGRGVEISAEEMAAMEARGATIAVLETMAMTAAADMQRYLHRIAGQVREGGRCP